MTLGHSEQSVEVGLDYLRSVGVAWPPHPATRRDASGVRADLAAARFSAHSHAHRSAIHGGSRLAGANERLDCAPSARACSRTRICFRLIVARMANVSIEHGNTHGSCLAYVWLGLLLGPHFDNYPAAFEFGQLGLDLVEKRGLTRFRARVYLDFSHVVNPWSSTPDPAPSWCGGRSSVANEIGDLTFAAYSSCNLISALLAAGDAARQTCSETPSASSNSPVSCSSVSSSTSSPGSCG